MTKLPSCHEYYELKIIKLFCEPDDFTQQFNKKLCEHMLGPNKPQSVHKPEIDISEMMCIEILYHHSRYKCFQYYNRRIHSNKVFKGKAARGKTATGWFYGLKLFLVINAFGEIMNAFFAPGNVADNHLPAMINYFQNSKDGLC